MNTQELQRELSNYYGTEWWYRHSLNRNMLFTDGVACFAENAGGGAYWFLDIVATEIFYLLETQNFLSIKLLVNGDKAVINVTDGNDRGLSNKKILSTDCSHGNWGFFMTNFTLMLPSEY